MNILLEKSETQRNIEAIQRAVDVKASEVLQSERKLSELRAELRGLTAALDAIQGKPTPRTVYTVHDDEDA